MQGAAGADAAPESDRAMFVCITPVLNEAWILDRFLRCAAAWADHIVIGDQGSTDGSREIARAHPKVTLVENDMTTYDEGAFRRVLVDAAQRIPGRKVIVALDADEALTANSWRSPEWETLRAATPGTVGYVRLVNVYDGVERCWIPDWDYPFVFVDDGTPYVGDAIHTWRIPSPRLAPRLKLNDVKVMHFATVDWERMKSRQRWYQCFEALNPRGERPAVMYRRYHHMDAPEGVRPVDPAWIEGYLERGIDITSVRREPRYRWDADVLRLFAEHGGAPFRRVDVWTPDWPARARDWDMDPATVPTDPRSWIDRMAFAWLARTQGRAGRPWVRAVDRLLRVVGW